MAGEGDPAGLIERVAREAAQTAAGGESDSQVQEAAQKAAQQAAEKATEKLPPNAAQAETEKAVREAAQQAAREAVVEQAARGGRIRRNTPRHLAVVGIATALTILLVVFIVDDLVEQPVLVTSLASSAFLLYYQPRNEVNDFRPLLLGHLVAAGVGFGAHVLLPEPYVSTLVGLGITILLLALFKAVHPPAVSTSLVFAYRPVEVSVVLTFLLTLLVVVVLALVYFFLRHGIKATRWAPFFDPAE